MGEILRLKMHFVPNTKQFSVFEEPYSERLTLYMSWKYLVHKIFHFFLKAVNHLVLICEIHTNKKKNKFHFIKMIVIPLWS